MAIVVRRLSEFTNGTLSTLYLDVTKDSLYADAASNPCRNAIVAVLDQVLGVYTTILAPITPHLAEEIFHYRKGATEDPKSVDEPAPSVFQQGWQAAVSDLERSTSLSRISADAVATVAGRDVERRNHGQRDTSTTQDAGLDPCAHSRGPSSKVSPYEYLPPIDRC